MQKKRGGGSSFKGKHRELKKHNMTKRRLIAILRDMGWIYRGKDKKGNRCIFSKEEKTIAIPDQFKDYVTIRYIQRYIFDAVVFGGGNAIQEFNDMFEIFENMGIADFIMISNRFTCQGERELLTKDCLPNLLN